jgi:hypothetical protein
MKFGLTLTAAKTMVYFDNDFSAENRLQSEDRIHRQGMFKDGGNIVDLVHLPVDDLVLETLMNNKRVEGLSLGVITDSIGAEDEAN